ncbi:hypothetical protein Skr01_04850 [Sphaerisporangium krabiense]|uniref:Uncharacterized protein n=1 Tax=Sphaerisporangium krabiense TaxID=763782 RepID=A0A7W8Z7G9_9ACTN|nr:hypothetical protein [Sphaerisporangium krabiense]MBB5628759.1 hypothetical protein [Sphaerisporangium krabiense]GII60400.1 hypothetical protein Skr01_04850 [Sphaerisporangium krabiense]
MTEAPDESGDILRRVLRAEAESVVPSADGLEIIRTRIEQRGTRGLRGVFWWRAGASALGAVLVAATVVMLVPNLREQFTPDQHPIVQVEYNTDPPDESSTRRPWINPSRQPVTGTQRAVPGATTSAGPSPTAKPTPSPTPGSECPTAVPSPAEPGALESAGPCASPAPTGGSPEETTRPGPSRKPTPSPTPTATRVPPPTPTATTTPETCHSCTPAPTASVPPSATPQMTAEGSTGTLTSETLQS